MGMLNLPLAHLWLCTVLARCSQYDGETEQPFPKVLSSQPSTKRCFRDGCYCCIEHRCINDLRKTKQTLHLKIYQKLQQWPKGKKSHYWVHTTDTWNIEWEFKFRFSSQIQCCQRMHKICFTNFFSLWSCFQFFSWIISEKGEELSTPPENCFFIINKTENL